MHLRRAIFATWTALVIAAATSPEPMLAGTRSQVQTVAKFANCASLNRVYPHGVGRKGAFDRVRGKTRPVTNFYVNTTLYNANRSRDGDNDGVACEKR